MDIFWFFRLLLSVLLAGSTGYDGNMKSVDSLTINQHVDLTESLSPNMEGMIYDLVIRNGRVIDPETGFDRTGVHVGIRDGEISILTFQEIKGNKEIDATELVVAPGFIDILSYDPNPLGVWNKIADGVTTNLAMHGGTSTPEKWYSYYERYRPPVNFGASFFYTQARNQFGIGRYQAAKPEQIKKLVASAEEALLNGSLGISFSLEYVPGISKEEIIPMMELAYRYNVPVFFHARYSSMEGPGTNIDALNELIEYARETGAAVHIDHINSTGGTFSMTESLAMLDEAREEGLDFTACTYPYDYWGTYLNSARFDEGWQTRFRISYEDLQVAGTQERLTKETFARYQKEGKLVVAYAIPADDVHNALRSPYVMIGSDAILEPGYNNHPRASGTFARTIGKYVREDNVISLMDGLAKMTILPAKRLEKQVPALKKKGRISKGSDADLVIFDYEKIKDQSTVEHPEYYSTGIEYVVINGEIVKDPKGFNKEIHVGEGIKSKFYKVNVSPHSLYWGNYRLPILHYNKEEYVDMDWLQVMGFQVNVENVLDKYEVTKEFVITGIPINPNFVDPNRLPTSISKDDLVLERGYRITYAGDSDLLISVGDKQFLPISFIEQLGGKLSRDGTNVKLSWE